MAQFLLAGAGSNRVSRSDNPDIDRSGGFLQSGCGLPPIYWFSRDRVSGFGFTA
jgi:hypothetical protein